ncbi:MAG: PAS domain-containing protein [Acidobacteriaceae bacterium]
MAEPQKENDALCGGEETYQLRAQRAESRLAELSSTMPSAYMAFDRDWRIVTANAQAAIASQKHPEEFLGKSLWEVWPYLIGTDLERQYRHVMETRIPVRLEHVNPFNDTWFEVNAHPIEGGVGTYFKEITQRKRAEDALKESERRYRALTELNPNLILMADAPGKVTYANQRLLDYIGMSLEDSRRAGWRSVLHPEDEAGVLEAWMDALAHGIDFEVETRIRRGSDGEFRWFWVRGLPVRDEQDKTLYWLGVCIEIHEHRVVLDTLKKSQQETERQRLELETVYRTAPIGLALFDPVEFRYLRVNDQQAKTIGMPIEEILGKTITDIAPLKGLREMFQQVAAGKSITNQLLEGELSTHPGQHRYWTVNYSPVYGPDGAVRAITAAVLEITARKRAEMALIQSEKLAAVGRLASSISHEINNPLEAVTNLLYLATQHTELPSEVRSYLQTAQTELARVSQIATQSLRFRRQSMNPTRVGTAELIQSVLDLYHGRLVTLRIQVHTLFASARRILCFENDIRQVLTNLIANSTDAMSRGGRLLLRTHDVTDLETGRKGVRMTVADTGPGIPAEIRKRVFEAFYTTKTLNGTGLGLWISRGIVERHGGRLTVKSSQKHGKSGTVFTMFLPDGLEETGHATETTILDRQPTATHS